MASRKWNVGGFPAGSQILSTTHAWHAQAIDDKLLGASAIAQATPDMTVAVGAFVYLGSDSASRKSYAGGNSPAFTAPSANPKIGLLTCDDAGTLAWTYGAESGSPAAPNPTPGRVPICEVYGRVGMTSIKDADDGSQGFIQRQASAIVSIPTVLNVQLGGHLWGLTLSNSAGDPTNDIDIAAGEASSGNAAPADRGLMVLAAALTKQLDIAWAAGTNAGGLDTGAIANATYHVWLIKRVDTGVVDALFSLSATAPTMPANYTLKRRIGSIVRASAAIKLFVQDGDTFMWKVPVNDINATNPGTAAVTRTLTVPTGIRVMAVILVGVNAATAADVPGGIYISDLSLADTAPSLFACSAEIYTTAAGQHVFGSMAHVFTNTSAQVRSRIAFSTAGTALAIDTNGWVDRRGRDS